MIKNIIKKYKVLSIFVIVIVLFFTFMNIDHVLEINRLKRQYEAEEEQLREMIPENTYIEQTVQDDKLCDEVIKKWINYYYGVSEDVTKEFRDEQLSELMTTESFSSDYIEYEDELGYEAQIEDIQIYYYPATETEKDICIFFTKSIIWPQLNPLKSHWYLKGTVILEDDKWKLDAIKQCEELITREEYNTLQIDTNGAMLDDKPVSDEECGRKCL